MRRTSLFAFLLLAACGGVANRGSDAVDKNLVANDPAGRQSVLFSAEAVAILRAAATVYSQDAIDSCTSAWLTDAGGPTSPHDIVYKPDVQGFRAFLSACLGGNIPNLRIDDPGDRTSLAYQ